ncbi:hypothetical protein CAFE_00770 [Caprobacter fermentans]|uniref:Lipoprotein n=1 Tax=Caproicibacter fermentans TaxID=2576756 RepID=A0A6N8HUF2_9FIRM|nr:hypothetical protein [Caproicibacter fermentans]MVB09421.1 hypothetical protein [Caproicibacter fermentans]
MVNKAGCFFAACLLLVLSGCGRKVETPSSQAPISSAASEEVLSSRSNPQSSQGPLSTESEVKGTIQSEWGNIPVINLNFYDELCLSISETGDLLYVDPNETLVVHNLNTGKETHIASTKGPTNITYGCINDNWVVWKQNLGEDSMADPNCEIYAYNRKSNKTNRIFKTAMDQNGNPISGNQPTPSLKDDRVLLDHVTQVDADKNYTIETYEYDLKTGHKKTIAQQFAVPKFGETGVFGLCKDESSNPELNYSVINKLKGSQKKPCMKQGVRIYDYATDGCDSVMYVSQSFQTGASPKETLLLMDLHLVENGVETLVRKEKPDYSNMGYSWPCLSKRIALWRYGQKAIAFDRLLRRTVDLSPGEIDFTSGFFTNNHYLCWSHMSRESIQADKDETDLLSIIRIDDLPTKAEHAVSAGTS